MSASAEWKCLILWGGMFLNFNVYSTISVHFIEPFFDNYYFFCTVEVFGRFTIYSKEYEYQWYFPYVKNCAGGVDVTGLHFLVKYSKGDESIALLVSSFISFFVLTNAIFVLWKKNCKS